MRLLLLESCKTYASSLLTCEPLTTFLQNCRSSLKPGEHIFDGRDSAGLVALGQVDQQPKAVALFSDDPAVLFQLVIDADDPVNSHGMGEALHGNRLLF